MSTDYGDWDIVAVRQDIEPKDKECLKHYADEIDHAVIFTSKYRGNWVEELAENIWDDLGLEPDRTVFIQLYPDNREGQAYLIDIYEGENEEGLDDGIGIRDEIELSALEVARIQVSGDAISVD